MIQDIYYDTKMIQSIGKKVLFSAISPSTLSSCATSCASCPSFSSCHTNNQSQLSPDKDVALGISSQNNVEVTQTKQYDHVVLNQDLYTIKISPIRSQSLTDWAICTYGK